MIETASGLGGCELADALFSDYRRAFALNAVTPLLVHPELRHMLLDAGIEPESMAGFVFSMTSKRSGADSEKAPLQCWARSRRRGPQDESRSCRSLRHPS